MSAPLPFNVVQDAVSVRFDRFDLAAYRAFLRAKALPEKSVAYDWETDTYTLTTHRRFAAQLGATDVPSAEREMLPLSAFLFDYQAYFVRRAVLARRFAIWADTGLGKTLMEWEFARQVRHLTGGKVLLLTLTRDLVDQLTDEAATYYPQMPVRILETRTDLIEWLTDGDTSDTNGVGICTYHKMIDGVIPEFRNLAGIIADESSILKSGGGVIKWNLIKSARGIPYKLSCTATPAPNDVMEYASQAAFLEKLRTEGEILWTYFTRGKDGKGEWTVKPHARAAFYEFLASWAIYIRNPARFGFADNLKDLPPPVFHEIDVLATPEQIAFAQEVFAEAGAGLFGDRALGITHRIKLSQAAKGFVYQKDRSTGKQLAPRTVPSEKPIVVARLIDEQMSLGRRPLVWTVFDEESNLIAAEMERRGVTGYAVLHGKMKDTERADIIKRFRRGEIPCLISKASLLGYGLNFQFCRAMIFSGWDDSYERFYQAVRRAYRYGQTETVHIYLPCVRDLEGGIWANVLRKKTNFEEDATAQEDCFIETLRKEGEIQGGIL